MKGMKKSNKGKYKYHLLYICLGNNPTIYRELIYSLLSFNKVAGNWTKENVEIIIFTDDEIELPDGVFDLLSIQIKTVSKDMISEWVKSCNDFFLIVKARILADFLESTDTNALLVDTDTFFMKDPKDLFEKVSKGELIMHLKEHKISKRAEMIGYFNKNKFKLINGEAFSIGSDCEMWNSGVIGINSS